MITMVIEMRLDLARKEGGRVKTGLETFVDEDITYTY